MPTYKNLFQYFKAISRAMRIPISLSGRIQKFTISREIPHLILTGYLWQVN